MLKTPDIIANTINGTTIIFRALINIIPTNEYTPFKLRMPSTPKNRPSGTAITITIIIYQ
jgi:hypothetical protein